MRFNSSQPIFLQIVDCIQNRILSNELKAEDRIPAVRDYAVELQVNPNTIVKSFQVLEEKHVIYKKRGLGYFVSPEAKEKITLEQCQDFVKIKLPEIAQTMLLLGIPKNTFDAIYEDLKSKRNNT